MGQSINRRRVFGSGGIDYHKQYLTFVSLADNNEIKFFTNDDNHTRTIYVSTNKNTWASKTSSSAGTTLATLNNGGKLFVKAYVDNTGYSNGTYYHYFEATGNFALEGNIMSLLYSGNNGNFDEQTVLPNSTFTFWQLFAWQTQLVDISNLVMPATTLRQGCYEGLFRNTSITSIPATLLPATTCAQSCYYYMFYGCSNITTLPSGLLPATTLATYCYGGMFSESGVTSLPSGLLPATILVDNCYRLMFYRCTSLTTVASDLMGATTLASACCRGMFSGCTSLRNSPDLNAATLVTECYRVMFNSCTSITYIKCIATSISASNATTSWLGGASSTGTFVRASGVSWARSTSGVPSGWTLVNA